MPQLDFTLPHWAYWLGLILFPIIAATLAKRPKPKERTYSTVLGYFILVTGGILGLHRLYLKSMIGLLYIPVFIVILFANSQGQDARSVASDMSNLVRQAERTLDREGGRVSSAEAELPEMRQKLAEAEAGSYRRTAGPARCPQSRTDGSNKAANAWPRPKRT
jgi:hypothetical protein